MLYHGSSDCLFQILHVVAAAGDDDGGVDDAAVCLTVAAAETELLCRSSKYR